jgi:hypothetical protein
MIPSTVVPIASVRSVAFRSHLGRVERSSGILGTRTSKRRVRGVYPVSA